VKSKRASVFPVFLVSAMTLCAVLLPGLGIALGAGNLTLQGTGATFPEPFYNRWFAEYHKLHPEVQINYQALGTCQ
jgi:ABC-type phosphate transport system substrate-binding protein